MRPDPATQPAHKTGWRNRFRRLVRYRLGIPMMRGARTPEYTARGVMMGVFWAMTPTFGIQMLLVFLCWLGMRQVRAWDFSLINGLAWTWTTNAFTVFPCYYLFYVTGQILLGTPGAISGYDAFGRTLTSTSDSNADLWTQITEWFSALLTDFGFPLLVGSIPWAFLIAAVSYWLALKFVRRFRARQLERQRERQLERLREQQEMLGEADTAPARPAKTFHEAGAAE